MEHKQAQLLAMKDLRVHFKVYDGTTKVLDGVNLEARVGEKIGLVGESSCGKTTTVKSILKVLPVQARVPSGEIWFDGADVLKMKDKELNEMRKQKLSMIFQDPIASLNPVFTVGRQIGDTIKHAGIVDGKDKKAVYDLSIKALMDCSMPDPKRILGNYPFQLSGGMRQRVCIAMALATASKLLIADEPTTNLDVTIQEQVLQLIRELVDKNGTSLILITHSLGVARQMTDRIYVMYAGTIVETAKTTAIFEEALHPYTKGLLASIPKLTGEGIMAGIPGTVPSYLDPPKGCRFEGRCAYATERCRREKPGAYDVGNGHQVSCFLYEKEAKQGEIGAAAEAGRGGASVG